MDMKPFKFALAASAVTFALSGCLDSSSSEPEDRDSDFLQVHYEYADVRSLRQDGDAVIVSDADRIWSLSADGEIEILYSPGSSFVEVLAPEHYVYVESDSSFKGESLDAGENWELSSFGENSHRITNFKRIDNEYYARQASSLLVSDSNLTEFTLVSGEVRTYSELSTRIHSIFYNPVHDQIWWTKRLSSDADSPWRLKRYDRGSAEVTTFGETETDILLDGFADQNDPNILVLGGEGGFHISYDNGENWQQDRFIDDENEFVVVNSVQQDEQSGRYYANVSLTEVAETSEMWCSQDQGQSWTRTELPVAVYGQAQAVVPMLLMDRDGERNFLLGTRVGVVEGPLSAIDC
ncbi:hypothetical protein CWE09_04475 [Aliidiomarina minuta]|uniref:Sortilin N-terminal domain-containing protein n=1 Tax=Aliidiomarina minuta TaxID=880057 RepID=A0A432W7L0_9GAMM|nr:hypothetical protein [Aliidiomarina minuta]RUO25989.1 hypothetical protein CWE09_04475 [Aliidiomarina minuta]